MKKAFLLKNTAIYTVSLLLPQIAGFLLLPLYTRVLAPSEYAIVALVNSFTGIVGIFIALQLQSGIGRYILQFMAKGEKQKAKEFLTSAVIFMVFTIIVCFILLEFFGSSDSAAGQGILQAIQLIGIFLMLGSTVIKGLQDKYGRRKIFIISTLGMTLGVLITCLVPTGNFAIYFLGTTITSLFLFNDMQYVYINEEMSSNKRAQAFTTAKIIGIANVNK